MFRQIDGRCVRVVCSYAAGQRAEAQRQTLSIVGHNVADRGHAERLRRIPAVEGHAGRDAAVVARARPPLRVTEIGIVTTRSGLASSSTVTVAALPPSTAV